MLIDSSFVLAVSAEAGALRPLRDELFRRLPESVPASDELLLVAGLLVRQAQHWQGGRGPVRLRVATLGRVVHFEVARRVDPDAPSGPGCTDAFHGLIDELQERTQRFTVSTFAGTVTMAAQKVVPPQPVSTRIDLSAA